MPLPRDRRAEEIEALYRSRFSRFAQVARAIVGDRDLAAEAVQDAFADVFRSRASFRGEGPLEAWVWRAVVNAARKSFRRPFDEALGAEAEVAAPAAVVETSPLIAALPERQRLAVFLRYYADLDYRAIAQVLEIEVGTVSATLAAAHRSIRKALMEEKAHG